MANVSLQYWVVGFFDILGFSSMVEEDSKSTEPQYLPIFLEALDVIAEDSKKSGLEIRIFSDSIIVATPLSPQNVLDVIDAAAKLQCFFLQRNILIRGGISYGKHYATANLMFSQALVAAYRIESKLARFPRIVIDRDALNFAWHHENANEELHGRIRNSVLIDRDGAPFVNYLSAETLINLTPHIRTCIEANTQPDETVLEKMRWLLDYQNYSSGTYGFERLDLQHFANGFSIINNIP